MLPPAGPPSPAAAEGSSSGPASTSSVDYDARYRKGWAYGKAPSSFLVEAVAHLGGAQLDILSLGEGQGRHAVHLASLGHRCVGVDASTVGLSKARALANERGVADRVATIHADLSSFDPAAGGARWDAIVLIHCPLAPNLRERVHRACARALRPGGVVIVECFAPAQQLESRQTVQANGEREGGGSDADSGDDAEGGGASGVGRQRSWMRAGPTDSARLVDVATLCQDFSGLSIVVAREVTVQLAEGRFHRGPGKLGQFIARRDVDAPATLSTRSLPAMVPLVDSTMAMEYCRAVDDVFAQAGPVPLEHDELRMGGDLEHNAHVDGVAIGAVAAHAAAPDRDLYLTCASALVRIACHTQTSSEVARCRYCWLPAEQCICGTISQCIEHSRVGKQPGTTPRVHWVILTHPAEFLRATSTAKLAARVLERMGSSEWLLYGCDAHEARLERILDACTSGLHELRVLFPPDSDEKADTVPQALQAARAKSSVAAADATENAEEIAAEAEESGGRTLVILVPDGSWECARALVRHVRLRFASRRSPNPMRLVQLDQLRVAAHTSSLLDALHGGAGRGRLSTLEAIALFLDEAHGVAPPSETLHAALTPLVEYVNSLRREEAGSERTHSHPHHSEWVVALEAAAKQLDGGAFCARGLRRCCVCGAALATHLRMQLHLQGRRHCEAVARRFLRTTPPDVRPTAEAAAEALHAFSTAPLCRAQPDPPDVALAALADARTRVAMP